MTPEEFDEDKKYAFWRTTSMYGGGFAKQLGVLYTLADHKNRRKIINTWPELWNQYLEMYNDSPKEKGEPVKV